MPKRAGSGEAESKRWPGATRLRKLCKAVDITGPTQLAAAIARYEGRDVPMDKLSVSGASGWWSGTRRPTVDNIASIIAVTGGSVAYLVLGVGDMFVTDPGAKAAAFDQMAAIIDRVRGSATEAATSRASQEGRGVTDLRKALEKARKRPTKGQGGQRAQGGQRRGK